jgi:hypothetical protein
MTSNCFTLIFLIYEENLIFFFISAKDCKFPTPCILYSKESIPGLLKSLQIRAQIIPNLVGEILHTTKRSYKHVTFFNILHCQNAVKTFSILES